VRSAVLVLGDHLHGVLASCTPAKPRVSLVADGVCLPSTTAAALALLAARRGQRVELITDTADTMRALLGLPDAPGDAEAVVVVPGLTLRSTPSGAASLAIDDGGTLAGAHDAAELLQVGVLRGPCYLSLRVTVDLVRRGIDTIVIVREPGRSLTRQDVASITGLDIVAETHTSPAVARAIDAGVLPTTIGRLGEFAPLERWLDNLPIAAAPTPATLSPLPRSVRPRPVRFDRSKMCTDLPLPLSGSGRRAGCVVAVCRRGRGRGVARAWTTRHGCERRPGASLVALVSGGSRSRSDARPGDRTARSSRVCRCR